MSTILQARTVGRPPAHLEAFSKARRTGCVVDLGQNFKAPASVASMIRRGVYYGADRGEFTATIKGKRVLVQVAPAQGAHMKAEPQVVRMYLDVPLALAGVTV